MSASPDRQILSGTRLDELFDRWERTYSPDEVEGFHRDGACNEAAYYAESKRVVFVQVEPNSTDGGYSRFRGHDLRLVFPKLLTKENTINMATFSGMALNGRMPLARLRPEEVESLLRRFACINLKKLSGTSVANAGVVEEYAWRDRQFLREQIGLLDPLLLLAGGPIVQRVLGKVLLDDRRWKTVKDVWQWRGVDVTPCYHPSVRPLHRPRAIERLAGFLGIPDS